MRGDWFAGTNKNTLLDAFCFRFINFNDNNDGGGDDGHRAQSVVLEYRNTHKGSSHGETFP